MRIDKAHHMQVLINFKMIMYVWVLLEVIPKRGIIVSHSLTVARRKSHCVEPNLYWLTDLIEESKAHQRIFQDSFLYINYAFDFFSLAINMFVLEKNYFISSFIGYMHHHLRDVRKTDIKVFQMFLSNSIISINRLINAK